MEWGGSYILACAAPPLPIADGQLDRLARLWRRPGTGHLNLRAAGHCPLFHHWLVLGPPDPTVCVYIGLPADHNVSRRQRHLQFHHGRHR